MVAKKKDTSNLIGSWAFLIGVILAVIFAFVELQAWVVWTLIIIGVIIGLLNIAVHEVQPFLFAGTVFVIVSALGGQVFTEVVFFGQLLKTLLYLFVPTTLIVALRSIWTLGKSQ